MKTDPPELTDAETVRLICRPAVVDNRAIPAPQELKDKMARLAAKPAVTFEQAKAQTKAAHNPAMTIPKLTTLTDEQINVLIAEACGWSKFTGKYPRIYGTMPDEEYRSQIPDYCSDLNAMHVAEQALPRAKRFYYAHKLALLQGDEYLADYEGEWHAIHATAKQRAQAFLLATGKAVA